MRPTFARWLTEPWVHIWNYAPFKFKSYRNSKLPKLALISYFFNKNSSSEDFIKKTLASRTWVVGDTSPKQFGILCGQKPSRLSMPVGHSDLFVKSHSKNSHFFKFVKQNIWRLSITRAKIKVTLFNYRKFVKSYSYLKIFPPCTEQEYKKGLGFIPIISNWNFQFWINEVQVSFPLWGQIVSNQFEFLRSFDLTRNFSKTFPSFHVLTLLSFSISWNCKFVGLIFWEGHKILRNLYLTFVYSTYRQK